MRLLKASAGLVSILALSSVFGQAPVPMRARSRPAPAPTASSMPIGRVVEIKAPLGLPPLPIPEDNPPTEETIELGRKLFFDKALSRDGTVSCSSCHDPKAGLSDTRPVSEGVNDAKGTRNAPPVINAVYNVFQFWDGRARSLEEQVAGPVENPIEFQHSLIGVERRLAADPEYVKRFEGAFGPGRITFDMVAKSIATYERTLLSGNSPFDRYYYGGDKGALTESAIRGLELFTTITLHMPTCANCHLIKPEGATFTEFRFHNTGIAWDEKRNVFADPGREAISGYSRDRGAFKVPSLRNIELTAPYMHDGSIETLEEVVDFYFEGGRHNNFISGALPHAPLHIEESEVPRAKADLVEFMKSLTGEIPPTAYPPDDR